MTRTVLVLALCLVTLNGARALIPRDLADVGVYPLAGARLPLASRWHDATGKGDTLGQALAGRPAVLLVVDYTCQTLCGLSARRTADALDATALVPGRDYRMVLLGIDAKDGVDAASKFASDLVGEHPKLRGAIHALYGDGNAIAQVTQAVGYRFTYDAARDQFAHPAAALVIAADGTLTRVLTTLDLDSQSLAGALAAARDNKTPSLLSRVRLLCYGFDPASGRYNLLIGRALGLAGAATLILLGAALGVFALRSSRRGRL